MRLALLNSTALVKRMAWCLAVGLLLAGCLFGGTPGAQASCWLGPIMQEVLATFRDPGTQWMVFGCCGMYFITFVLLRQRASGARFWRWENPDVWLTAVLVLAAARYAFGYGERAGGTEALVLLGGAVVGKAMAWAGFKSRKRKAESRELKAEDGGRASALLRDAATAPEGNREADRKIDDMKMNVLVTHFPVIVPVFLGLLVWAVFWRNAAGMQFQYREQARWSGPWDNPNGFGMLMGVGLVLAAGALVAGFRLQVSGLGSESVVRNQWSVVSGWLKVGLLLVAAGILGLGLVKSYSRGAWVGTAVGLGFLGWGCWDRGIRRRRETGREQEKPEVRRAACDTQEHSCHSRDSRVWPWLRCNFGALLVIAVSVGVLAFWSFRHTEQVVARRALSVGNVNDFSWRNRVAAWVGALQMMAERPLTGHGWNQVERVYDQYYRVPSVQEGMAIQLNDYLTLGATLGIPALACFLGYVGLSLVSSQWSAVSSPRTKATDYQLLTTDSLAKATCRAGALVLLISFWFDGGLFRLATATVFWMLMEVGREA